MSNHLVRVKDPTTGTEYTTGAVNARNKRLTVIDKPATDAFGRALPAKRNPHPKQEQDQKQQSGKGSTGNQKNQEG